MKYFYKFLSVVALVALFIGCAKEQSSFSAEDIPGRATIIGSYHYDSGQDWDDDVYIQQIKPLANHIVYAQVSNSSLKSNSTGYTIYETVTDAKGNFSISIPATLQGTSVQVYPKPFTGKHKVVVGVEDNEPIFDNKDVVYVGEKKTFTLLPNDIKFHDALCSVEDEREEAATYNEVAKFNVLVYEGQSEGTTSSTNSSSLKYTFEKAKDVDVIVTISGKSYGATSTSGGVAEFAIPAETLDWKPSMTVKIKPYKSSLNYYYWDSEAQRTKRTDLDGCYKLYRYIAPGASSYSSVSSGSNSFSLSVQFSELEGKPAPVIKATLIFEPYETFQYYNQSNWNNAIYDLM